METAWKLGLEDGQELAQRKEGTPFAMSAVSFLPWPVAGGRGHSLNVLTKCILKSNLYCDC